MKNAATLIAILFTSCFSSAQSLQKEVQHPDVAGKLFRNPAQSKSKVQGSPYMHKMFAAAIVEKINVKANMRYNIYADEFEFITTKNDTLILDKIDDFSEIDFPGLQTKYKLLQYTDDRNKFNYGYLIDIYQNGVYGLFKKENIGFVDEKIAKTTLEMNMDAKYSQMGNTYFLKNDAAGIVAFPSSKKALLKLFPNKKQALETFVKDNKIDFDKESSMVKIIDFLAAA